MNLQLIEGQFSKNEVLDLVNKMVKIKIDFHEQKIGQSDSEEDIKQREKKIKSLQHMLQALRDSLKDKNWVSLNGQINLS
jgi:hypothetical protein